MECKALHFIRFVSFFSFRFHLPRGACPEGVGLGGGLGVAKKGKKKRELPGGLDWFSLEGGTRVPATVVDFLDTVGFLISDVG